MAERKKYKKDQINEMKKSMENWIANTDDPVLAYWLTESRTALKYWITEDDLFAYTDFKPLITRALKKQQAFMIKNAMEGGKGTIMSIFRLKQKYHGFSDRFEQDITTNGEKITFVNAVPRPGRKVFGSATKDGKEPRTLKTKLADKS